MNIQYDINSETGLMNLKFKKNILDPLNNKKEIFEKYILPMLSMNDKFILTGSLSLKLLGFEKMDDIGDFDFGLLEEFNEEEYQALKNFFQLTDTAHGYDFEEDKEPSFDPNAHLWQFIKEWKEENENGEDKYSHFKLDIFNDEIIRKRDIININYDEFPIKLVHPSITLSYRMRYALDIRSATAFKYWNKMKTFIDDAKPYYNQLRLISKMIARTTEHNANVENDKNRLNYLKNLITSREINADNFFDKAFITSPSSSITLK